MTAPYRTVQDGATWFAHDDSRDGCWAAAPTRDEALVLLGQCQVTYDETVDLPSVSGVISGVHLCPRCDGNGLIEPASDSSGTAS